MLVNENMMEGNATVCRLSPTESLYELQQALDAAGASTFIQKNWTDEENARAIADIVIFLWADSLIRSWSVTMKS